MHQFTIPPHVLKFPCLHILANVCYVETSDNRHFDWWEVIPLIAVSQNLIVVLLYISKMIRNVKLFFFHIPIQFSWVSQSYLILRPHVLKYARLPCPSPTPGACANSCPLSRWCHPTTSHSVIPFFSHLQSFPASGSFPMSQLFPSGGQSIGVSTSASVLPVNIQDWFPLGLTSWISLQSKGLSRVFSNTTVQEHQFFSAQLSL